MNQDEHNIRMHSITARLLLLVQTGNEILKLSRSMGIADEGFPDFMMGLLYSESQNLFRKESNLDEKIADDLLLRFWQNEGRDIRNRIIQRMEEKE